MIPLRKFHSVATFVLLMAPVLFVTGCANLNQSPVSSQRVNSVSSDEPGAERLVRYCRRMAETNNLRIAIGVCQRALEADPGNPRPVLILAEAYAAAGQRKEAGEAYEFALMIDGTNGDAHFGLGKLYLQDLDYSAAKPHLISALEAGKKEPAVFNAIGILHDQLGQHDEAQAFYRSGLDIEPGNTALANNLGVSLVLSRNLEEGVSVLGALKTRRNPNLTSHSNLEMAQAAIGDAARPKATELQPSSKTKQTNGRSTKSVAHTARPHSERPSSSDTPFASNGSHNVRRLGFYIPQHTKAPERRASGPVVTAMDTTSIATLPSYFDEPVLDPVSQSDGSTLVDLAPEVPAVPVEIVAFKELPPFPERKPVTDLSAKPATVASSATAELSFTHDETDASAAREFETAVNSGDFGAQAKGSVQSASMDPITIIPRRKPAVTREIVTPSSSLLAEVGSPSPSPVQATQILYANVPHLPIEMPGFEPASKPIEARHKAKTDHQLAGISDHRPSTGSHQMADRPDNDAVAVQAQDPAAVSERTGQEPAIERATISLEPSVTGPNAEEIRRFPGIPAPMMADTPNLQQAFQIARLNSYNPAAHARISATQWQRESHSSAPPTSIQKPVSAHSSSAVDTNHRFPAPKPILADRHEVWSRNPVPGQQEKLLALMLLRSPPNAVV